MILDRLRPKASIGAQGAQRLYLGAVAQSRAPALYALLGIADSPEGRFELLTLHVLLLIDRLKADGREGASIGQRIFDTYISDLDGALREMGVGDLSVGRKMKNLGQAFYGRAAVLNAAFASLPDQAPLRQAVSRTLLEERADADPAPLAIYVQECRAALAAQPTADLHAGLAAWPAP